MSEEEFQIAMQEMACGKQEALRRVYKAYLKLIYAVCFGVLKNREAAEDVSSEFFIRLYKSAATFHGDGHHKTWICTIAKNMCIDHIRKNSREVASLDATNEEGDAAPEPVDEKSCGASSVEEQTVNRILLEQAMRLLTDKEREIMDMKCAGGMTFREIATALSMPQGTVSWHYNTACAKLRRLIRDA